MSPRTLRWLSPCLVLLLGCGQERRGGVAAVNGAPVAPDEVRRELRAWLWRHGETWGALDEAKRTTRRHEALDRVITNRLVAGFAGKPGQLSAAQVREAEEEFQQFLKQFEPPEGWKPRFELQGLNEVEVRRQIEADVVQRSAIEAWLSNQAAARRPEEEARAWFAANRDSLRIPEHVRVSHVFLTRHDRQKPDRRAEIMALHQRLVSGTATLRELTAQFSEDERSKRVGGDLGWISRERVPAEFAAKVFSQPTGVIGEPFLTPLGWHIALVHERAAARLPSFDEVKQDVLTKLENAWRAEKLRQLDKELRAAADIRVDETALSSISPEG